VWVQDGPDHAVELVAFDPAFAGEHLPALLADVKATFHNVLAHPWWLYEPSEATARRRVRVRLDGDRLVVDHDHVPGPVRSAFLASKTQNVWRPLVGALAARDLLPSDWADVVRAALFCCPTLVMDLRAGGAGGHTPVSSAIGWAVAVAAGSPTADGSADAVGSLLAAAAPPA
ncbi:MAG: hypothetical protein HGA44_16995, partial [Cellulomonadaceae bacterium]|nr:hypothetical protein [Cellulomonadaceae bacterium]